MEVESQLKVHESDLLPSFAINKRTPTASNVLGVLWGRLNRRGIKTSFLLTSNGCMK